MHRFTRRAPPGIRIYSHHMIRSCYQPFANLRETAALRWLVWSCLAVALSTSGRFRSEFYRVSHIESPVCGTVFLYVLVALYWQFFFTNCICILPATSQGDRAHLLENIAIFYAVTSCANYYVRLLINVILGRSEAPCFLTLIGRIPFFKKLLDTIMKPRRCTTIPSRSLSVRNSEPR